jgi:hypothetical protein
MTTTKSSNKPYNKNCRGDDAAAIEMGMKILKDQGKAEQVFNNPPIVRLLPSVIDTIIPNDIEDDDNSTAAVTAAAAAAQQHQYQQ